MGIFESVCLLELYTSVLLILTTCYTLKVSGIFMMSYELRADATYTQRPKFCWLHLQEL